ncbi:MAG: hypothetical protein ACYTAN_10250 [Planctomycetota bacterium]
MRETQIWKAVLLTMAVTAAVFLLVMVDPGFLSSYAGPGVIPVSTGERIEMLAVTVSPLRGPNTTELYWLTDQGDLNKVRSFEDVLQCVTAADGALFITFRDGTSSVIEDGEWKRGISPPYGFNIFDVASLGTKIHAFGLTGGEGGQASVGEKLHVAVLDDGWHDAGTFDAGKQIVFAGCTEVAGGIEVVYGAGPMSIIGRPEIEKVRWYHVLFDGEKWGEEQPIEVPERLVPRVAAYKGQLALCLLPLDEGVPVRIATVSKEKVEGFAEVTPPDDGQVLEAWLVELAGQHRLILCAAGKVWEITLDDGKPGAVRTLMEISRAARIRSHVYVAVLIIASLALVSLGVTWLVLRLAALRARSKR